jgi:hypothetical protein
MIIRPPPSHLPVSGGLDEVGDLLQAGDKFVPPQAEVAESTGAATPHLGGFNHDQTATAGVVFASVHKMPAGREAFFRCVLVATVTADPL